MNKAAAWVFGLAVLVLAANSAVAEAVPVPSPGAGPESAPPDYRKGLEAANAGRLDEAEAAAKRMLDASAQSVPGRQLMGMVKARKGDLTGAVAEFDRALATSPQAVGPRAERAVAAARLGQLDKSRADLETLRARATACGKGCPPELRVAISRIEAALAASGPPTPSPTTTPNDGSRAGG